MLIKNYSALLFVLILLFTQISTEAVRGEKENIGSCWDKEVNKGFIKGVKIDADTGALRDYLCNLDTVKYIVSLNDEVPVGTKIEIKTETTPSYKREKYVEKNQKELVFTLDLSNKNPFLGCAKNTLFIDDKKSFEFSGPEVAANFFTKNDTIHPFAQKECKNNIWIITVPTIASKTIYAKLYYVEKASGKTTVIDAIEVYPYEIKKRKLYNMTWEIDLPCSKKFEFRPYTVKPD